MMCFKGETCIEKPTTTQPKLRGQFTHQPKLRGQFTHFSQVFIPQTLLAIKWLLPYLRISFCIPNLEIIDVLMVPMVPMAVPMVCSSPGSYHSGYSYSYSYGSYVSYGSYGCPNGVFQPSKLPFWLFLQLFLWFLWSLWLSQWFVPALEVTIPVIPIAIPVSSVLEPPGGLCANCPCPPSAMFLQSQGKY